MLKTTANHLFSVAPHVHRRRVTYVDEEINLEEILGTDGNCEFAFLQHCYYRHVDVFGRKHAIKIPNVYRCQKLFKAAVCMYTKKSQVSVIIFSIVLSSAEIILKLELKLEFDPPTHPKQKTPNKTYLCRLFNNREPQVRMQYEGSDHSGIGGLRRL